MSLRIEIEGIPKEKFQNVQQDILKALFKSFNSTNIKTSIIEDCKDEFLGFDFQILN